MGVVFVFVCVFGKLPFYTTAITKIKKFTLIKIKIAMFFLFYSFFFAE